MGKFEVQFYEKENGKSPVEDFILGLWLNLEEKIIWKGCVRNERFKYF